MWNEPGAMTVSLVVACALRRELPELDDADPQMIAAGQPGRRREQDARSGKPRGTGAVFGDRNRTDNFLEFREKLFRHPAGGRIDQARTELGDLAADVGFDAVAQQRDRGLLGHELDRDVALGESGNAPLPLAHQAIADRRDDIAQGHFAGKSGLDRADLDDDERGELGIGDPFKGFTSRDACLQDFRIIQGSPDVLACGIQENFVVEFHWASIR